MGTACKFVICFVGLGFRVSGFVFVGFMEFVCGKVLSVVAASGALVQATY